MGPDLRQMRYVVAVAREHNFTRAAVQLHVAQQALSQQVRAVEKMLGAELFDRASRPVKLTPAGVIFVQEARRALSAAERVAERTNAAARGELGKIRLAYTFAIAYETLPALLAACHAAGFDPKVDDTSTGSTAWNNIAAGRGVALVVASAAPQVPRGIALVRLGSPEAHIILDALWPRDNELPAVRRLIQTMRRVSAERKWL